MSEEARKDDSGKPMWDALPWKAINEMVDNFHDGAHRYGRDNYLVGEGLAFSRLFAAMQRHGVEWWLGEDRTTDSQVHHLACVASNALMLLEMILEGTGIDDRPENFRRAITSSLGMINRRIPTNTDGSVQSVTSITPAEANDVNDESKRGTIEDGPTQVFPVGSLCVACEAPAPTHFLRCPHWKNAVAAGKRNQLV